ncbi:MAG: helix-turn-helix domain-containing protein [Candidatus Peregrinibacteria bacterium]|nr:helix-turn-helix domain-containing protein [Candidatus Peregrinibacteria bacterium]
MANLRKIIQDIGLSEKEARVYLASLEVGNNKVSVIAKKCGLNRVTTYDVLERLLEHGLVSLVIKDNQKMYAALDPKSFVNRSKDKLKNLEKALPLLKKLSSKTDHPKIEYFEGINGIKQVYADTLTAKSEILNYASSELIRKIWPEYDDEYITERIKRKIFLRGIAINDECGLKVVQENEKSYRDIRLVPNDLFDFSNEINIYDDKISIISLKHDLVGIIIENEDIANTQRSIFKMAWEFTKYFKNSW